jgi:ABC-2 type transport system ATP-binding protein
MVVADGLVKNFGPSVRALDGVSFEVARGTVLGLLGPNGAGKTTAVRVLTTLLRPDAGRAEVAGIDVVAEPERVRRLIGLAGQAAAVDEHLTGRENLTLVGRLNHLPRGQCRERAARLLDSFDLAAAADRPARTYSGGMRRRLDLAAALVAAPPVVLLDEPTTGLDPRSRADLWAVIEQLVADGTTVLLTTQYLEEADRLTDRIVVVDHGRVIAEGTAAELKSSLGETVVEVSLATAEQAERAVGALAGVGGGPATHEPGSATVRLGAPDGSRTVVDIVRALDAAALAPAGLNVRQPSLDDVFLALTGHVAEEVAAP